MSQNKQLSTPVLFLIFNRPNTTKKVFNKIRSVKPSRLYIAADGPRNNIENSKCGKVRKIATNVDWECEINTLFRDKNLGCKHAVSSALDWFFEHEDMGIILEDDCLPNKSFFRFCEKMLNFYRSDNRIMQISGTNNLVKWKNDLQDYHFSIYGSCWGWATWKRAWELNDLEMKTLSSKQAKDSLRYALVNRDQYRKRLNILNQVFENSIDSWAYTWFYTRAINSGLSVVPSVNLVSNIGFGKESTHTQNKSSKKANLPRFSLNITTTNSFVVPDRDYDKKIINTPSILGKIKRKVFDVLQ